MEKVQQIREERGIEDKNIGNLKIYDEQRKIKEILERITEKLERDTYLEKAYAIREWMEKNETTRPPRSGGKDLSKEEQRLGEALQNIRRFLIKPYEKLKTEKEREEYRKKHPELEEVKRIIEEIDRNNVPVSLRNARKIKEWMEENGTARPPSTISNNNVEQKLGGVLANIRNKLIKPYKVLKTEEEREGYINKLENRKKEPMTREQFMEILDIVEEIDKKRKNLTELIEQSKATQEKVEEAKKLESMYEQELNGKEQKESSGMGDDSK